MRVPRKYPSRLGVILPLAAACLVFILVFTAFTVDLGMICLARVEAQNCADAAALAAAAGLYPDPHPTTAVKLPLSLPIYQPVRPAPNIAPAAEAARLATENNGIADRDSVLLLDADLTWHIADDGLIVSPPASVPVVDGLLELLNLRAPDETFVNAARVRVRRDPSANGNLRLFFSPVIGQAQHSIQAEATAAVYRGFGAGAGDKLLPLAMDVTIWNALRFTNGEINAVTLQPVGLNLNQISLSQLLGNSSLLSLLNQSIPLALAGSPLNVLDGARWERGMTTVTSAPDGIWEAVLLADQLQTVTKLGLLGKLLSVVQRVPALFVTLETGTPGSAPNAARLNDVIRHGLSLADVQRASTTSDGQLWLPFSMPGYFEIPTECEGALREIIGQPRIIPLYATLPGTVLNKVTDVLGMPHTFQFVGWGAVVVTEVNLSGPLRYINVQPAVYARHSITAANGSHAWRSGCTMSDGVYTTPHLVK